MTPILLCYCLTNLVRSCKIRKLACKKLLYDYSLTKTRTHTHTHRHTPRSTHSCSSSGAPAETQTPARRGWTFGSFQRSAPVRREREGCCTPTSWWPLWSPRSPEKRPLPLGRGPASPAERVPGRPCWGSADSKCPGSRSDSPGWTDLLPSTWRVERQRH